MRPSFFNPATGLPVPIRQPQRVHLKHSAHQGSGTVTGLDGSGFTVAWDSDGREKGQPRTRCHYRYGQADAFALGNRPYAQDQS